MEEGNAIRSGGRRRRIVIVLAACVLVGIGVVAFWPGEREPEYDGRKLSEWLQEYKPPMTPWVTTPDTLDISERTVSAVQKIGTNALPTMIKWIRDDRTVPRWKMELIWKVYLNLKSRTVLEVIGGRDFRASRTVLVFKILGADAKGAIPDLVRVARDGNKPGAAAAIVALSYLGKEALPPLLVLASDQAFRRRYEAIRAIGGMNYLGTNTEPVLLRLVDCLKDPDLNVVAADLLDRLGLDSDLAIPALAGLTQSADPMMRRWGMISLGRSGEKARTALPEVRRALQDADADVRKDATNALREIAPAVLTNGVKSF